MKIKFKKILIILFFLLIIGFNIQIAEAAYNIEVSLPSGPSSGQPVNLTQYIKYLYMFGLSMVGIAALLALVIGGFMYMGTETVVQKDQAKKIINGALSGLVLGLAAYLILYTINPDLINFKITAPPVPATQKTNTQQQSCVSGNCPASCEANCEMWSQANCKCYDL